MTTPHRIGRYEIKSELGRGGMATVYHAYDPRFERDVAIKVLPRIFLHDPTFRARFEREAKTVAVLDHPAIVPVYDYGEENELLYLVMRYMDGGSLADRIRLGTFQLDEVLRILAWLAPALDDVHAKGVIHRDLKPANILFDSRNYAYLSDFGIVKLTEATAHLTGSGIVGTPQFMAPEMAASGEVTSLIDIYALGVTLFQMLTGRLPYDAPTPLSVMMAHANSPVPDVRQMRPDLPPAVQVVIEQVLAKDPFDRYQSAGELVSGLRAVVADEGEVPLAPTEALPGIFPTAEPTVGDDPPPGEAGDGVAEGVPGEGAPTMDQFMTLVGADLKPEAAQVRSFEGHGDRVLCVTWSPDGGWLASGGRDSTVIVWNATTAQPLHRLGDHALWVTCVAWSPDGVTLASGSTDGRVILWDTAQGALVRTLNHDRKVRSVAWSPDGQYLVSGSDGGEVAFWEAATGRKIHGFQAHTDRVNSVLWSPDGNLFATGAVDHTVVLWRVSSYSKWRTLSEHADWITAMTFSPDGRMLATASWDNTAIIWDLESGQALRALKKHSSEIYSIAWSPDGKRLATGSWDHLTVLWDAQTGKLVQTLEGSNNAMFGVAFSPDGTRLAAASRNKQVLLWTL